MRAHLGEGDPTWDAVVTLPNGAPHRFSNLPCDSGWKQARWVGFSSVGREEASYYLDDLAFELE
jgi:hypothetical protein